MDNAIVKRLNKLADQWFDFTEKKDARLCRWLITIDEQRMMDTFCALQDSDGNNTGDFFLMLTSPFESYSEYSIQLHREFLEKVKIIKENVDDEELKQWLPPVNIQYESSDLALLSVLGYFAQALKLPEGLFVVYLYPNNIKDIQAFENWLVRILRLGIPLKVRFSVLDYMDNPALSYISENFPMLVHTNVPDLKMDAAMNELASAGDPNDPAVQFRKIFVQLTQAVGKLDIPRVEDTASRAMKLASEQKWPSMKVAVCMAQASAYIGKQDYFTAYDIYGAGYNIAYTEYIAGDKGCGSLAINTLFAQGSTMISAKRFDIAVQSYTNACPIALETEDYNNLVEAWRMKGHCFKEMKNDELAWKSYWQAMDYGPKIEKDMRETSTLPFVGEELLMLCRKRNDMQSYDLVESRMVFLVGENWYQKVKAV